MYPTNKMNVIFFFFLIDHIGFRSALPPRLNECNILLSLIHSYTYMEGETVFFHDYSDIYFLQKIKKLLSLWTHKLHNEKTM